MTQDSTGGGRFVGGRYELSEQIGRGGMAEVWGGRDTRLGRSVAIKLLRTDLARDPSFQARFKREAQSSASLNHPAIVAVYDTGEDTTVDAYGAPVPQPYIVMEYLRGRTVKQLLGEQSPLDIEDSLRITAGVLDALHYSHQSGIIHRDIKPANVMVTDAGEVKVMDFGIARAVADTSATMTGTNAVLGTAQYLSPEQARGDKVDARSDLYSAGCLLYEALTGRPPFVGDNALALAYQHVGETPQPPSTINPQVSPDLDRVVMHSLAKAREDRYQSAEEFIGDLDRVATGLPVEAPASVGGVAGAAAAGFAGGAAGTALLGAADNGATQQLSGGLGATASTEALPQTGPGGPGGPLGQDPRFAQGGPPGGPGGYPGYGNGPGGPYDDQLGEQDKPRSRTWQYVLLGLGAVAVVGFLVFLLLNPGGEGEPTQGAVPDVTGLTVEEARASLEADGFTSVEEEFVDVEDSTQDGLVQSQDPEGGTGDLVDLTTTVTLQIGQGPGEVVVPDVRNRSQEEARQLLEDAGLTAGNVSTEDDPDVDAGNVIRTEPAAGDTVQEGTAIALVLSSGQVRVPNVIGQPEGQARDTLLNAGLGVTTQQQETDEAPPGTVVDQDIREGQLVEPGTQITLTIAQEPEPDPTPTTPSPTETTPTPTDTDTPTPTDTPTSEPTGGGDD